MDVIATRITELCSRLSNEQMLAARIQASERNSSRLFIAGKHLGSATERSTCRYFHGVYNTLTETLYAVSVPNEERSVSGFRNRVEKDADVPHPHRRAITKGTHHGRIGSR